MADERIILEVIGDDTDKFIRITKPNGERFIINNTVQFYIDNYEGLGWNENDIEALLKFLGFNIFKVVKPHSKGGNINVSRKG